MIEAETSPRTKVWLLDKLAGVLVDRKDPQARAAIDAAVAAGDALEGSSDRETASTVRDLWLDLADLRLRSGDRDGAAALRTRLANALAADPKQTLDATNLHVALASAAQDAGDTATADAQLALVLAGSDARLAGGEGAKIELFARRGDFADAIQLLATTPASDVIQATVWAELARSGDPAVAKFAKLACSY